MARNTYNEHNELDAAAQAHEAAKAAAAETPNVPALAEPVRTTPPALGMDYLPDAEELDRLMRIADVVSRSAIVPANYRTTVGGNGNILQDKRPNVMVAALMGRTFGWDLLTAMRNIHVIEGAASLKPESMLGLIRARGHRVRIVRNLDSVTVHGRRADTGDEQVATFGFADAYRAGLASPGDNGLPRARSKDGKPLPWEQYPLDMCQWRAVAQLCRGLFADVALGLAYTPEELGALVDAEGAVVVESAPMPTDDPPVPTPTQQAEPAPTVTDHGRTVDEVLRDLHDQRAAAAVARSQQNLPELRKAQAHVWEAAKAYDPDTTDAALSELVAKDLQDMLNDPTASPRTAKPEDLHALAEEYESRQDAAIRAQFEGATNA